MARTVRDAKLETRSARNELRASGKPYYRAIDSGLHLGYRKGKRGGKWVARWYEGEGRYKVKTVGPSDDVQDADGVVVLNYSQAQATARELYVKAQRIAQGLEAAPQGPYTIREAIDDYIADYRARSDRATGTMLLSINANILPDLGEIEITKLTRKVIRDWHHSLANRGRRVRTRKGQPQQYREAPFTPDEVRQRRSTANKMLTILKSSLNHAFNEGIIPSNAAWAAVKPFKGVDAAKIRFLDDAEAVRLVNASPPDLRAIVTAALLTGARYGEIANLVVNDFDARSMSVFIAKSKSAEARHVALTDEAAAFFENSIAGMAGDGIIFHRQSGGKWRHAHQTRPIHAACNIAKIKPAIGFNILRHTYASRLAMKAVPMSVIAKQLGHSDTRMTEKHYAHLAPSYVKDTVRAALGVTGLVQESNVTPLASKMSRSAAMKGSE